MKVLALDIATQTGVAVREGNNPPLCWSVDLGKGRSEDARFSRILVLTDQLIKEHEPDFVAVEAAIGGPKASHYLIGLVACVRGCAANRGVPVRPCYLSAIRKHFLGKALSVKDFPSLSKNAAKAAIKSEVMKRCSALKWDVPDHDAADAAALADYAIATAGGQVAPAGGLFT